MVQWLELHPFMAEDMGSIVSLVGELRSHKPHRVAKREKKTKGRGGGRAPPWLLSGKEFTRQCRSHGFNPWSREIPHAMGQLNSFATTIKPMV